MKADRVERLAGWKRLHALYSLVRSRMILEEAIDYLNMEIHAMENWLLDRETKLLSPILPATAQLNLDGQELTLISTAMAEKANDLISKGDPWSGEHHLMIALKVRNARVAFHARHMAAFQEKYGLNKKEPAGGQTLLG